MSYRPSGYVPKKNKIEWKVVLLVFIVVMGFFTGLDFLLKYEKKESINYYGVCGYNDANTRLMLENEPVLETLEIKDYLFYGETLNLYQNPYQLNVKDPLIGKTIILKDLCTQDDFLYILEGTVDGQIPLEDLEPGFYSVMLQKDNQSWQLITDEKWYEEFYTVRRNGKSRKITIQSDRSMFNNPEDTSDYLSANMLYIHVEETEVPKGIVDIVIDPGHFSYDSGNWLEVGAKVNGRTEAQETYDFSQVLKQELEKQGLNVIITRKSDTDIVNSYGLQGRLHQGYEAKAKYYLDLQMMSSSRTSIRGTQVIYSSFSSSRFASTVYNEIIEGTSLVSTGSGKNKGILESGTLNGYDGRMMIRESGGRILGAGTFSEKAQNENGSFAKDNRFGMQTLTLEYAYLSNEEDMAAWDNERQIIAEKTAQGIARYLRIVK